VWLETDATEYTGITTRWITLIKKTKEKAEEGKKKKKHLSKEDSFSSSSAYRRSKLKPLN